MKTKLILAASIVSTLLALLAWRVFLYAPPVAVAQAVAGEVEREVRGPGVVSARIQVTVSTRVTGILKVLHADQGDRVKTGQLLAVLDDADAAARVAGAEAAAAAARRNIAAAEAALAKARADSELAQSNFRREEEVFGAGFISQAAMDTAGAALKSARSAEASAVASLEARQAEAGAVAQDAVYARALRDFTHITAPMDGLIVTREAEAGNTVSPGSPIFRLVDTRTLWVAARIDESVVGLVEIGQPATIRLRGGQELAGVVARIDRQSDAATRELEVAVAFRAPPARFAMDQEAEVVIQAGKERGPVIPVSALFQQGRAFGVLVVKEGRAEFRPLRTGASDEERVAVREGIGPGEWVICKPAGIRPGSRVRAVTEGGR